MKLCVYAHPFDLKALSGCGGLGRLRDLGVAEIALATSYHDGRWLMPWHPEGPVRFLEDGTVHFRPRADYGPLQPQPSGCVPAKGPSPLELLVRDAALHGLRVRAWTVFTHNSRLGALHPEQCVENAFGDLYRYALCPAQPAVRQYTVAMVRDLADHGVHTVELEALGQMGWKHSSHHDKASFTPTGLLDAALSACFCASCANRLANDGHDPERLRAAVVAFVQRGVRDGCAMAPAKQPSGPADLAASGLDTAWLAAVLAVRARTLQELGRLVVDATPETARAVQVHPHAWFTGSQLAVDVAAAAFPAGDERVLTCYGEGPEAIGKALAAPGFAAATDKRLCLWPKAPQFTSDEDLVKVRDLAARAGVASIAIYHLGLLPWRTLERAAKMLCA
ncbi:MAG: hypothetical protein JNK15_06945 [Planctomycetes bacterium]|nr:hypothetical protein [Planctomycetota bacterium]